MKTTNFHSASSVICCSMCLFVLGGCNTTLNDFSRLEEKSLENGTVAVGAARVMPYDNNNLKESRGRLREALLAMRNDANDMNMVPQVYGKDLSTRFLTAYIDFTLAKFLGEEPNGAGKPTPSPSDPCLFHDLSQTFREMISDKRPKPSAIEMIGLRMAAMKFIESEIEDLNVGEVYHIDPNYRRVVVSLDLTAWVSSKASAALVYVDLYPYKADDWCHEAAEIAEGKIAEANDANGRIEKFKKEAWPDAVEKLKELGVNVDSNSEPNYRGGDDLKDWVAFFHSWLEKQKLCPRIIQVERMSPGEYSILAEGDYSETELQLKGTAAKASGGIKFGSGRETEQMSATVRPLNLAFVAGDARAGWLFMPIKSEHGRMPPTERRLRMVVDVPKKISKLGLYVHKSFLDSDLHIISDTDFAHQVDNMEKTRQELTESESFYKKYEAKGGFYRLIKTRIRNLLYQGWSEEIVVDIP